jgi:hypothetical protein
MDDALLDRLIGRMVRERDPEYRLGKLLEIDPAALPDTVDPENLEGLTLDEFLLELMLVAEEVEKHLAMARRFCCKSRPRWEKCAGDIGRICHRLLANPCILCLLSQKYSYLGGTIEACYYDFCEEVS